jgi:hypothetical protein
MSATQREIFRILKASDMAYRGTVKFGDHVAFETHRSLFLSSADRRVVANATSIGTDETFLLLSFTDKTTLGTVNSAQRIMLLSNALEYATVSQGQLKLHVAAMRKKQSLVMTKSRAWRFAQSGVDERLAAVRDASKVDQRVQSSLLAGQTSLKNVLTELEEAITNS